MVAWRRGLEKVVERMPHVLPSCREAGTLRQRQRRATHHVDRVPLGPLHREERREERRRDERLGATSGHDRGVAARGALPSHLPRPRLRRGSRPRGGGAAPRSAACLA